jgi:hypothetical protein
MAWVLGVMVALALAAVFVAVVMVPRGAGETSSVARVALVDAQGNEVFRSGTTLAQPSRWHLSNGLARVRVEGERILLSTRVAGGAGTERPVAEVAALSRTRRAIVSQRSADAVSVAFVDGRNRRVVTFTMARGVPGVYAGLKGRISIAVPEARGFAFGRELADAESPLAHVGDWAIHARTPILVTGTHDARILLPLNAARVAVSPGAVRVQSPSGTMTTFLGLQPLERNRKSLTPGAYAVRAEPGAGPMRIERVQGGSRPPWVSNGTMIVPYVLDDAHRSGVARSISVGLIYRAAALG